LALKKLINGSAIALMALGVAACGGGSSSGGNTPPPPPPPPPDSSAPTVSFSPATLTVIGGGSGSSTLSATDNVAVTTGPTTTCTNGGSFSGGIFTAPVVTATTTSVCTATAGDAAGNSGTGELTVTINPDMTGPSVTFTPATLTVASGGTGTATVTVTDNSGAAINPTFSCTNGGSFSGSTFTSPAVTANTTVVCTATATDPSGNPSTADLTVMVTPPPAAVTISGKATYDFVPHTASNGLDYANTSQRPIKGATIELLGSAGAVLDTSKTDANGDYSFSGVTPNTDVRVRVKAEMVQSAGAQWDVRVQDNTSSDALYALQGSLTSSGTANATRNLNAPSGWTGSNSAGSYTAQRQAGPFAVIDPIYDALIKISAHDSAVIFPPAKFNWSINNRPSTTTNLAVGDIGTSSYRGNGDIYILGAENNDTDEYDDHVNVHEWGHYFEDQLSRSDSIGGQHGGRDRLDPRVAMGEGFGNALSGMITDDPFYRDSNGLRQGGGFEINVENNSVTNEGWFNESSVQSILYDIYDSADDSVDTLSAGIGPIYDTFTALTYKEHALFTTIFTYMDELSAHLSASDKTIVDSMAAQQDILGVTALGDGDVNDGNIVSALPVYKAVTVNGPAVEVCSVDDAGEFNKLGNRAYLTFDVTSDGSHTFTMTRTSGVTNRDPDFVLFKAGTFLGAAVSGASNTETGSLDLTTGTHVIDAYDDHNVSTDRSDSAPGDACYDFTITR